MDATQKSIDDAYTALHDCDNDPNRAVNLLLEGIEVSYKCTNVLLLTCIICIKYFLCAVSMELFCSVNYLSILCS